MMQKRRSFTVPVEVSARHVHLAPSDFAQLFGADAKLSLARDISEPGQFAAREVVSLSTPKAVIERVRIIGPLRSYSQVEISRTDAVHLGLNPPVRRSHELTNDGTSGIKIIGPKGTITLSKGVIIPWRHLHASNLEALELKLTSGELIVIRVAGERAVIFENVLVQVDPSFQLSFHLDTDEGNAAGVTRQTTGEVLWSSS